MGRILTYISISLIIAATGLFQGCGTSECLGNQSSIPLAGLYSADTEKAISIDSITVYGYNAPNDSMLLNNAQGIEQIYLPLRINVAETQYIFHYDQKAISGIENNDTITLKYTSKPYFDSFECGAMYQFEVTELTYTEHIMDSVGLVSKFITNADVETIKIFLKTTEPEKKSEQ